VLAVALELAARLFDVAAQPGQRLHDLIEILARQFVRGAGLIGLAELLLRQRQEHQADDFLAQNLQRVLQRVA
jgi:hypothetical protein